MKKTLRRHPKAALSRFPAAPALARKVRDLSLVQRIPVDYRVDLQPRDGHSKPPHAWQQRTRLVGANTTSAAGEGEGWAPAPSGALRTKR